MTEETKQPGRNTRLFAAAFCPNCQFSFVPRHGIEPCPSCGHSFPLSADHTCDTHIRPPNDSQEQRFADGPAASLAHEVDELIGQNLGVYRCDALLGAGAMGRVYLAHHRDLHRKCALKILPPSMAMRDPAYVLRFMNEGQATAALNHPNIVTIHAIGEERGYHFIEMEFVAGRSLRQLIEDEGIQQPVRATALALRIAEGLAAAHTAGILHRDLKPDNVMLTHQGVPKITDFGLARRVVVNPEDKTALDFVGTPQFMAPELFEHQPASPASDVYALGVCYFNLLTGQLPYRGDSLDKLIQSVRHDPLPSFRSFQQPIPMEMAECAAMLLAKAAQNRPQSGVEAVQLLEAILGQSEDLESLIQKAFANHPDIRWRREGRRYRIDLTFSGGRHQTAFVEPSDHAAADRLLRISSVCCPALSVYFEPALRLNSEILHGALAIAEIDKQAVFVMVDNYPLSTVDPEEIRRSVLEVAHRADAIEKLLTGLDLN
ncbi:serine/threonine-protein kinase [Schlesneria paludicola]|uniref:serine/threonine-protein kinase n=1 Tax=Schlesneria paludicola TaxID=360056 RepID=UPI000299DF51|nr:serine/threonine-protein kinase [Schlesneria paludicola]